MYYSYGANIPAILAGILLVIAASRKLGKERGAILIFLGAIGLIVLGVGTPILYYVILPQVARKLRWFNKIRAATLEYQFIMSIIWGVVMALIAIGTFMRSAGVDKPSAGQTSGPPQAGKPQKALRAYPNNP